MVAVAARPGTAQYSARRIAVGDACRRHLQQPPASPRQPRRQRLEPRSRRRQHACPRFHVPAALARCSHAPNEAFSQYSVYVYMTIYNREDRLFLDIFIHRRGGRNKQKKNSDNNNNKMEEGSNITNLTNFQ